MRELLFYHGMRRALCIAMFGVLAASGAPELCAQKNLKLIKAFLSTNKEHTPMTQFSSEVPKINVFWKGEGLEVGDKIRAVFVAEDVGEANPKETKISEKVVMALKQNQESSFFLARPGGRTWPIGKYRLDFFINDKLAQVVKFTIAQGPAIETKPLGSP
ncbi:MAG TPA: hypothetical protein VJ281_05790 [Chthoniobacterales bacterium]|jgi:hypothetical protein|nr:hypothetical protein [Chthoniobacterales bacterium]